MDWSIVLGELVTQVMRIVLPVCIALIIKWAIMLYHQIQKDKPDFATILKVAVDTAVVAAEQLYGSEEGEQKKEYAIASVQDYLAQNGLKVDVSVIADAIEATVYSLHRENFFLTKDQWQTHDEPVYEVHQEGAEK